MLWWRNFCLSGQGVFSLSNTLIVLHADWLMNVTWLKIARSDWSVLFRLAPRPSTADVEDVRMLSVPLPYTRLYKALKLHLLPQLLARNLSLSPILKRQFYQHWRLPYKQSSDCSGKNVKLFQKISKNLRIFETNLHCVGLLVLRLPLF